jgi:phosphopantetheine adenylyltransferase
MYFNQLYGIFGRIFDTIETLNIYNKDLTKYLSTRIVKSVIHINADISTLLMHSNISSDILNKLNSTLNTNLYS